MRKRNCWEIKKCGREQGGVRVSDLGICPAAVDSSGDGINNGKNGGRICWAVNGTFCDGEIQENFAQKAIVCMSCIVFKTIKDEESSECYSLMKSGHVYKATGR